MKLLQTLEGNVKDKALSSMVAYFERVIRESISLLAPQETNQQVVVIAASLATGHAIRKGKKVICLSIKNEKKMLCDEFERKRLKFLEGVPLVKPKEFTSVATVAAPHSLFNSDKLMAMNELLALIQS